MQKFKLLYAEDEIETRKNNSIYLNFKYNLEVFEADDGEEAFELYITNKPDIIITDITMPKLDGLSLVKKIRNIDSQVQIIVITAHGEQEKLLEAVELNLVSYILKPINRKKLNDSMQKAIESLNSNITTSIYYFNINSYFDIKKEVLIVDNKSVKLTFKELELLKFLILNKNQKISSEDIFSNIWDYMTPYSKNGVRTLIKKLRDKLPLNCIANTYGGYYSINIK